MLCQFLVLAGKRFWFNVGSNTYLLLSFCCGGKFLLQPEKKDTVVCLVGARSLLRPEKKRYSRLSDGCAVLAITTGNKKIQSSVWRVVLLYQFLVLAGN